jgi:hypothetical protein
VWGLDDGQGSITSTFAGNSSYSWQLPLPLHRSNDALGFLWVDQSLVVPSLLASTQALVGRHIQNDNVHRKQLFFFFFFLASRAVYGCSILGSRRRARAEPQRAPRHCHQLYRVISTTMCNLLTHSSSESECSSACRPFWPGKSRCSHQNWSLVGVPAGLVLFTQAA